MKESNFRLESLAGTDVDGEDAKVIAADHIGSSYVEQDSRSCDCEPCGMEGFRGGDLYDMDYDGV